MTEQAAGSGWDAELTELGARRDGASQGGGADSVNRQHAKGKLTVRERISRLADAGSFREVGSVAGTPEYAAGELKSFLPANFAMGTAKVDGRRAVLAGEDFTVRGGSSDGGGERKSYYSEDLARQWRLPLIRLLDGTGGSVKTVEVDGRSYIPTTQGTGTMVRLLGEVPVVSAVLGPAAGWVALKAVMAHFTVMVKRTGQVFVAGPPVVRRALGQNIDKDVLGGWELHGTTGVVDNVVESEDEAFEQVRRFLSYMPGSAWELPPRAEPLDPPDRREEALTTIIPRNRRRGYDPRKLLDLIVDRGSYFEIAPLYGRSFITALARFDGYVVGLTASDPRVIGGAMDRAACEKLMRFVDLCDTFHIPMVHVVDNPGFMIGLDAEREATIRAAARAMSAGEDSIVPWLTVIVRRCFGVAGGLHAREGKVNLRYAWPSAEWGSLPVEGGVEAAYSRQIAAAPDPEAERRRLEDEINALSSPFLTAEIFGVEEIIDPRETRPILCEFAAIAQGVLKTQLGPRARQGMRP